MVIPTVEQYHPDAYPLNFLGQLLAYGKKAPMYKVIVEEKKLAPRVRAYNGSNEIAGEFQIRIRTFPNVNLNDVMAAIDESFQRFETESITEQDVERIKAGMETSFYSGLSSILYKGFQLARYNEYAGSPGFISTDLANIQAVTKEDILRVYEKYIKDKPYVLTSFVPKGSGRPGRGRIGAFPHCGRENPSPGRGRSAPSKSLKWSQRLPPSTAVSYRPLGLIQRLFSLRFGRRIQ